MADARLETPPYGQQLRLGLSTGGGRTVQYRIGTLRRLGLVSGDWLDLGTADGYYAAVLLHNGARTAVGLDIQEEPIARARTIWPRDMGLRFIAAAAEAIPFPDASFDGVLLQEVLANVADEEKTCAEIARVLRPGGHLALYAPNRWFPFEGSGLVVRGRPLNYPIPLLPWLPQRLTRRFMKARNYWPRELRRQVETAGLEVLSVSFAYPLFDKYGRALQGVVPIWMRIVTLLERTPVLRRFGISTLIIARKPPAQAAHV